MRIVALAGGVGGAKLMHGLARNLAPEELTGIVNTGDDFQYLGLHISPDLDTVCYTLAGLANPVTGWGRLDESWNAIQNLVQLGGPSWFNLGDRDLGTHLERTRRITLGDPLSAITRDFCTRWGVPYTILPMSDERVATWVNTVEQGWLPFQEYFVRERCSPRVISFDFRGADRAKPAPGVIEALEKADWVILCPSNPWVSIDPILLIGDIGEIVRRKPLVAVSPIIGGKAIKGPAAKMYQEMGIEPSAAAVAAHYHARLRSQEDSLDQPGPKPAYLFFMDTVDAGIVEQVKQPGMEILITKTIMNSDEDRERLAQEILHTCKQHLVEG